MIQLLFLEIVFSILVAILNNQLANDIRNIFVLYLQKENIILTV